MKYDFDLFVIGGGSAGVRVARTAGALGARVGLAEEARLGGTCVNVGCIPKKLFVYAGHVAHEIADAAGYGWSVPSPTFDWATLRRGEEAEVARLNQVYRGLLTQTNVSMFEWRAKLTGPNQVEAGGKRFTAEHIVIATGSTPKRPDIPGAELGMISDDCFTLEALPRSIFIVGSGYIALEFATIFASLGVETTVALRGERVLPHFDRDVGLMIERELAKKDVRILTGHDPNKIERRGERFVVTCTNGSEFLTDRVLLAVGRKANVDGLGLDTLSIKQKPDGAIAWDDEYRTNVPSIRAIGDVIGHLQLTPVALAEGTALAKTLFGGRGTVKVDYHEIPTAIFTMPEVATVGLTEARARATVGSVDVYQSDFRPLRHTVSGSNERTFMKLVVDAATDRVLGVHVVGPSAAEIVQGFAVALKCGATKAQLDGTMGIHPTSAEELVTMRTKRADAT